MNAITICEIGAAETRGLRQQVLRPHQGAEELVYPGDDAVDSVHFGAFAGEVLVGVGSLYLQSCERFAEDQAWRLRGMAVAEKWRSGGIGSELLRRCLEHATARGGRLFWCQARPPAVPFYQRHGLAIYGEAFDVPGIGPHLLMARTWP